MVHGGTIMSERVVELTTSKDLEQVIAQSFDRPVFIYKHSTMCSVSSGAYRVVHGFADTADLPGDPFFSQILVIENRDISDAAETRLGVRHESPQILLLQDGKVTWHTSHFDISDESLNGALAKVVD